MIDARTVLLARSGKKTLQIHVVTPATLKSALKKSGRTVQVFAATTGFAASPMEVLLAPDGKGALSAVYVGAPLPHSEPFQLGSLASKLPPGHYAFGSPFEHAAHTALGWCLELYRFDPHRRTSIRAVTLECPRGVDRESIVQQANATFLVRDLINMPANILGPDKLEKEALHVARKFKARTAVIKGEKLKRGFPLIHVVGAAAEQYPRLVDFSWGNPRHPKVTLVGKGVCFDTGGLDIKPASGMLLMKKDMGGAATVLGLAQLVMAAKLKLRLRVLLPIVENSISDEAFRPGDVFKSRKGLTVEIGNTDAEGRLILSDALAFADEESPELLIDMATLTGAARVALGLDLPPFYTDDDQLALAIHNHGAAENDPVYRLPLWRPYHAMIESPIADTNNSGVGGFAGSITAALFLRKFVEKAKHYVHFDIFGWVPTSKAGRPKGGEAQVMRAVFSLLKNRYGK